VTQIGRKAFSNCIKLTNINLPKRIASIAESTFAECYSLEKVNIPESVVSIDNLAFDECMKLTGINLPEGIHKIGKSAFGTCTNLKGIYIPRNLSEIGYKAFSYCNSLTVINVDSNNKNYASKNGVLFDKEMTKLICYPEAKNDSDYVIPDGVTAVCSYAFAESKNLERIDVPNSVAVIGENVFYMSLSLKSINVDAENKIFSSKEEVLFDKEMTRLIFYPSGKNNKKYTIPDSVKTIKEGAFLHCKSLLSLTIPKTVTTIEGSKLSLNSNFIIKGYEDSAAYDFALKYNIAFFSVK
jgi:hypothetical protein